LFANNGHRKLTTSEVARLNSFLTQANVE